MPARLTPDGRRGQLGIVLLFLLLLPAITARFYASDEFEYFAWLRSWTFDRDVDFQNEYQYFYDTGATRDPGFYETFLQRTNEAGRRHNFAPVGTALLWMPFYAIGHAAALATGAPVDGLSQPYITSVAWGSAIYGGLALLLSFAIARRVVGGGALPVFAVWIGTPLLFYMYVAPGFSHACSAFAVALFLLAWLKAREGWCVRGAIALGVTGGIMAMVREQDVFFVAGPAVDYVRHVLGHRHAGTPGRASRAALRTAVAGAVAFLVSFAPQIFAYLALNGHPWPTDAVARKMTWTSPHFAEVLLSPAHGYFFWTPLALVGFGGLVWLAAGRSPRAHPDARWIGLVAVVMFVLQVYVSGAVESWTVAGSFGQRRFVSTTALLVLGLAALWAPLTHMRLSRGVLAAVLGVCVWWNLGLMAQFGLNTMDRQRLTLASNIRMTFLELPLATPGLVWRYLTDRSSFYQQPRR